MKVPTAVEFLQNFTDEPDDDTVYQAMIAFAQEHAKAQTEAIINNVNLYLNPDTNEFEVDLSSIREAYPLTNII